MRTKKPRNGDGVYMISAIAGISLWSTSFVVTKIAYATFPPLTLGACRFLVALIALAALAALHKGFVRPSRKDAVRLSLSGLLGITMYMAMENIGVKMTSASNAAMIIASYPAITLLLERIVYKTAISAIKWLGIGMAIAGVYIVTTSGPASEVENVFWGNIILIATGVVWAAYNFVTRSVVSKYPAKTVSFYQTFAGTVAFLPLALLETREWMLLTATTLASLLYLGLFCSVAAYLLYNHSLRRLSAGTAVTLMNFVPVFGVALSVLVLDERLHAMQVVGGIIVIAGVFISIKGKAAAPANQTHCDNHDADMSCAMHSEQPLCLE